LNALLGKEEVTRYKDLQPIGLGAFGLVCSAKDTATAEPRAIKKIAQPFKNTTLAKRAFRELMLLSHLQHENVRSILT
jgi:p38 MAP kinase